MYIRIYLDPAGELGDESRNRLAESVRARHALKHEDTKIFILSHIEWSAPRPDVAVHLDIKPHELMNDAEKDQHWDMAYRIKEDTERSVLKTVREFLARHNQTQDELS